SLQVPVGNTCEYDRALARRGRIQLAAQSVEDLGDLLSRVGTGPLEQQVLDEVGDARFRVRLVPRPGADPEPERDRADAADPLGDQPLAGVELGEDVLLHALIVDPRES